jgi:Saccharopine dehydrogenase NADP binding domain
MATAVVFGGYGTFGGIVARELAKQGILVTVAGRDGARAEFFAESLGPVHRGLAADVTNPDSCRASLQNQTVAVNCAGPFGPFADTLLEACLDRGCHYVDIADDRDYCRLVRGKNEFFEHKSLAAVYGCSSLPAISGALALSVLRDVEMKPERVRVTLLIGNNNPKGRAAIASLVHGLGKPIQAPQGIIRGFRNREVAPLPPPFDRRAVFNFDSPEYDLFPELLGVQSVAVKVGFEFRPANYAFALLATLGLNFGTKTTNIFAWLGNHAPRFGTSGAAIMTELFFSNGSSRQATMLAREDGQRMAALPCALAAREICREPAKKFGTMTAYEFLGAPALLDGLTQEGFELSRNV